MSDEWQKFSKKSNEIADNFVYYVSLFFVACAYGFGLFIGIILIPIWPVIGVLWTFFTGWYILANANPHAQGGEFFYSIVFMFFILGWAIAF
jgi:hypothetical protein